MQRLKLDFNSLNGKDKESVMKFLVEHDITFGKVENSYVARVNFVMSRESQTSPEKKIISSNVKTPESHSKVAVENQEILKSMQSRPLNSDLSSYTAFCSMLQSSQGVRPARHTLSWTLSHVHDVFKAIASPHLSEHHNSPQKRARISFPEHTLEYFVKKYGVESVVNQNAWAFVFSVHLHRKTNTYVNIFASFLEQHYEMSDMVLFFAANTAIQSHVAKRLRGRPTDIGQIILSWNDCLFLTKSLFQSCRSAAGTAFLSLLQDHQGSTGPNKNKPSVEYATFLHIALEYYRNMGMNKPMYLSPSSSSPLSPPPPPPLVDQVDELLDVNVTPPPPPPLKNQREITSLVEKSLSENVAQSPDESGSSYLSAKETDALIRKLHQSLTLPKQNYMADLLMTSKGLPPDVVAEIELELRHQLEQKVSILLSTVISLGREHKSTCKAFPNPCDICSLQHEFKQLLARVMHYGTDAAETSSIVNHFAEQLVQSRQVKQELEPFVALLVTYARSRLIAQAG